MPPPAFGFTDEDRPPGRPRDLPGGTRFFQIRAWLPSTRISRKPASHRIYLDGSFDVELSLSLCYSWMMIPGLPIQWPFMLSIRPLLFDGVSPFFSRPANQTSGTRKEIKPCKQLCQIAAEFPPGRGRWLYLPQIASRLHLSEVYFR